MQSILEILNLEIFFENFFCLKLSNIKKYINQTFKLY